MASGFAALTHVYLGQVDAARAQMARFRRLQTNDPFPFFFDGGECLINLLAGRHEKAVQLGYRALNANSQFLPTYRHLAASLGHLGRIEEAEKLNVVLAKAMPDFSTELLRGIYPMLGDEFFSHYAQGLERAGVPTS